jgi:hypothetical protein
LAGGHPFSNRTAKPKTAPSEIFPRGVRNYIDTRGFGVEPQSAGSATKFYVHLLTISHLGHAYKLKYISIMARSGTEIAYVTEYIDRRGPVIHDVFTVGSNFNESKSRYEAKNKHQ